MKNNLLFLGFTASTAILFSTSALADSPCMTKQKNAAAYTLANELAVPVQGAEILEYNYGAWTEAVFNNVGSDEVTVRLGNRNDRGMTAKTYTVYARQIDDTDDCTITSIEEVTQ